MVVPWYCHAHAFAIMLSHSAAACCRHQCRKLGSSTVEATISTVSGAPTRGDCKIVLRAGDSPTKLSQSKCEGEPNRTSSDEPWRVQLPVFRRSGTKPCWVQRSIARTSAIREKLCCSLCSWHAARPQLTLLHPYICQVALGPHMLWQRLRRTSLCSLLYLGCDTLLEEIPYSCSQSIRCHRQQLTRRSSLSVGHQEMERADGESYKNCVMFKESHCQLQILSPHTPAFLSKRGSAAVCRTWDFVSSGLLH